MVPANLAFQGPQQPESLAATASAPNTEALEISLNPKPQRSEPPTIYYRIWLSVPGSKEAWVSQTKGPSKECNVLPN